MAVRTKTYFTTRFATGYILTAEDMDDLIDSVAFLTDVDDAQTAEAIRDKLQTLTVGNKLTAGDIDGILNQTNAAVATSYDAAVPIVSQVDAEAGTSTVAKRWTPERVRQAVQSLGPGDVTQAELDVVESKIPFQDISSPILSELKADLSTAKTDIVLLGDSRVDQGRFQIQLLDELLARTNSLFGGIGYVGFGTQTPLMFLKSFTGSTTEQDIPDANLSTSGTSMTLVSVGDTYTITPVLSTYDSFTNLDVWYIGGGGTFTIRVDGALLTTVDTSALSGKQLETITGLPDTSHTVVIELTAGASVVFTDSQFYKDTGLTVHKVGNSGATSGQVDSFTDTSFYSRVDPAVVLVWLGANDHATNISPDTTAANITSIKDRIVGAAPDSGFVYVGETDNAFTGTTFDITDYIRTVGIASEKDKVGFLPLKNVVPDWVKFRDAGNAGVSDLVHPNQQGGDIIAKAIADFFYQPKSSFPVIPTAASVTGTANHYARYGSDGTLQPDSLLIYNPAGLGINTDGSSPVAFLDVKTNSTTSMRYNGALSLNNIGETSILLLVRASGVNYSEVTNNAGFLTFKKFADVGTSNINFDPIASDGTSAANVQFFRTTNTAGGGSFRIYVGDGSGTLQHLISTISHTYLNVTSSNLGVGVPLNTSPTSKLHVKGTVRLEDLPAEDASHVFSIKSDTNGNLSKGSESYSASATLDFPSVAPNSTADLTLTVTGASLGDVVSLGVPNSSMSGGITYFGWVSSANIVTIRVHNSSGGAIDPASGVFKVKVSK